MTRLSGPERRRQIVEAAYELIAEKGLSETATSDVTRKLNVGSGLLHHYFSSWKELRAEAVRTFVLAEIAAVDSMLASSDADELVARLTDWMVDDPGFRHWSIWLNAIEEARRDPAMAAVVQEAYRNWHAVIVRVLRRLDAACQGCCSDPVAAAWRLSALMDGLAGILIMGGSFSGPSQAKRLLRQQFAMEISSAAEA
ncbi:MAG: TetR family transcriptional regulator C-terminal domain-containing protein [Pseudomonadota bacterium]